MTELKMRHFIDANKTLTFFVILAIIFQFEAYENTTLWVYLALHGGYGFMWCIKSLLFPDSSWERPASWGFGALIWTSLGLYWSSPYIIASQQVEHAAWYLGVTILIYAFGVFFHFASDMQKFTTLQLKKGLITSGLFSLSRNINYFGEFLIYGSFVLLSGPHWFPAFTLALFIAIEWIPNMLKKDKSLSRYPEFAAYKKRTALFVPFVL